MSIFDLWLGHFSWYEMVFRIGSIITGMFLLLLAGLAFTRLFRHPRPARFFLAAIGLALVSSWGIDRASELAIPLLIQLGAIANSEWIYFALYFGTTVLGIVLAAATWWCLMLAVFDPGETPPAPDGTIEEFL